MEVFLRNDFYFNSSRLAYDDEIEVFWSIRYYDVLQISFEFHNICVETQVCSG